MATRGLLRGVTADGFFIDIGIPEDLARAGHELPLQLKRPAIFFDCDVDVSSIGEAKCCKWIVNAAAAIRMATMSGRHIFFVTSDAFAADQVCENTIIDSLHRWVCEQVRLNGGNIDHIKYSANQTQTVSQRHRRANSEQLLSTIIDLIKLWELDRTSCLLVSEHSSNIAAANAAGIVSMRVDDDSFCSLLATLSTPNDCPQNVGGT